MSTKKNNMIKLDGKLVSEKIKNDVKEMGYNYKKTPILAIISIGNDELSKIYINNKKKACEEVGISLIHFHFNESDKEDNIIKSIKRLNKDDNVNGISIELPIIGNFNINKIINSIDSSKDVDCLTNISQGKFINNDSLFKPCTLIGLLELLDNYYLSLEDKHVLIVGNDNIICKPLMIECAKKGIDVTMCTSESKKLKDYTKSADFILSASNKKYLINNNMIKEGCVIIDVGVSKEDGRLYGDVNPNVKSKASFMAPRVGGVGPMSISMLLKNTMTSYLLMNEKESIDSGWSDIDGR